jgi:hypothetical protein
MKQLVLALGGLGLVAAVTIPLGITSEEAHGAGTTDAVVVVHPSDAPVAPNPTDAPVTNTSDAMLHLPTGPVRPR